MRLNNLENNINKREEEKQMSEENKNDLWEESQRNEIIEALRNGRELSEIMKSISNLDEAFSKPLVTIGCSDERVPGEMGVAGQLILASDEDVDAFVETHKGQIETVTSHDGCGAAAVRFQEIISSGQALPPDVKTADELGVVHSQALAKRLLAEHEHIRSLDSNDPEMDSFLEKNNIKCASFRMRGEVHDARSLCLDGTGRFNPKSIKEMLPPYVCSGPGIGLSDEYCKKELRILSGIATGSHGFGERFTKDNPFYIFVSAKDEEQQNKLESMAKEALADFGERIQVKSFVYSV
jgi:hypothetical protein